MDFTRVATFLTCPEKYRLHYAQNLRKIQEDAYDSPKLFGQAIHAGLQAHYEGKSAEDSNKAFLALFPEALDPNDLGRTPPNGLKLLDAYRHYWLNQDKDMKVLGVEVIDRVDIGAGLPCSCDTPSRCQLCGGLGYANEPWEVKLDLIVETPNGIWGVDHKTTSKPLSESYWRTFEPNSQVSGYLYYLQQKYGQVSGFIINGIQVGYRQRAYKGEPVGFHWTFQRQYFNRTQAQLKDWKQRMQATIGRMLLTTQWEKNEAQCSFCEYRELCLSVGNKAVEETLYERVENPLAYLKEGTKDEH